MAQDNAAQAIKDLQTNLDLADQKLSNLIKSLAQYEVSVATIFARASRDAIVSIDDVADYVGKKMKTATIKEGASPILEMLGLKEAKQEVEKVPTMFERVIAQINQKAEQQRGVFTKKITDAESAKQGAEDLAMAYIRSFMRVKQQAEQAKNDVVNAFSQVPNSLKPFIETSMKFLDISMSRGHQGLVDNPVLRYAEALKKLQQLDRKYGEAGVSDAQSKSYRTALYYVQEYIKSLQRVEQAQEQANQSQEKFKANISAVEGVTRRYNDNEQALAKLQQRWEELNVKKQAGFINEKDFKTQTQQILDEYDRLIAKRKEFEIGDLGQMSYQRKSEREQEEERLAQLRKSNTQARLDDEMRAEKMIKQARAERAKKEAEADANMKKAVSQQITSYKQLYALLKQYNSLKQVKSRTQEEEAALERTRQKIKEIIAEMRKLDSEQKGSLVKARDITEYDRILAKDKEITNEKKKQNDLTKQQKANLDSLLPALQRLASAFGIAFSVRGLAQFGKKLIETRGEFELQQVALRSILQNKQLADEIWDKTMQAALQSPFTAMQLTKYTKQLAAYRIETDKLFDTTKRLADVSAGLGVDMQRLILAYGQVKAANYLRASEIRQFTEAGVNILGELSRYFTETRGQMYNTAQVMEMVTKRMVKFEDVEAIFKRMTDQGGIFYNMQYVQSQTVKGQIAKLHDAYDQMLNSIGKANQGTLRTLVGLLNNIVKNWREWKTVLDSIMWPLLITSVYKFGRGLLYANAGAIAMNKNVNALTRAGARLNLTFKKLNATIAANPWMLLVEVLVIAGTAIWNHAKAVREVNKEYDEMNGRMLDTQYRMTSYDKKINENNKILKEGKKGTKEYNEAQSENKKILSELQRDYPDVAEGMTIANDGIIAMTNSMKEYNAQLRLQILLNERAKAGFFEQSLGKDAKQMDEEINKQQTKLAQYTQKAQRHAEIVRNIIASGKFQDNSGYEKWLEQLEKIASATSIEEYEEALKGYTFNESVKFKSISGGRKITSRRNEVLNEIKDDYKFFGSYLKDMALLSEDFTGEFVLSTEGFIEKNREAIQSLLYTVKEDGTVEIGELGYALSKAFLDAASVSQTEEGQQTMIDTLIQQFKDKYGLDIKFGVKKKKGETTPTDPFGGNKNKESASKLISLIKEMRSEYDKLSKSAYGYAKSQDKVRQSYEDSVREILGEAGVGIDYDFTTNEGMIAALEKVKSFVQGSSKYAKDAWKDVQKYIDQLETEIEINAQVRIREDFGREIEEMFKNYELTVELQKINLPEDAAKELFGFDYKSLNDILERTKRFRTDLGEDFDEEDEKVYTNWLNKVEDKLFQIRKERAKEYTKYLEQELSERAKLEMQYVKDVSFVEATFQNGEQKTAIIDNLKKNYEQSLKELQWKSFKESDFYVEMMQDLTSMPSEYLDLMMQKLDEWANKADVLSPRALKEVLKAREKVLEAQVALSPVRALNQSLGVINGFQGDTSRVDENGNQIVISKYIKESRKQLQGIIAERAKSILQMQDELDIQEALLGKIKAQEEIQETLSQLSQRGVGGISVTSNAESDLANIDTQIQQQQYWLDAMEEVVRKEGENEEAFARRQRMYEDERKEINIVIELLKQLRLLREQADKAGLDPTANLSASKMGTIANVNRLRKSISDAEKLQATDQGIMSGGYAAWNKAVHGLTKNISSVTNKVKDLGNQFYDTLEAVGVETNAVSDAWMELGNGIFDTITQTLELIPSLITGFEATGQAVNTAMGVIGLIAEAIQLTLMLIKGIAKIHDAKRELEIERQQENIDNLQRAYERLEKQIEKTWSTVSYIRTYREETQNLYEQYEALTNQINAEEAKKNTDKDKLQDYQDKQQEILDTLEEIKQQQIEVFGGIGEDSYRSAAEGFVDAWKSAFLETGDGLQGLQDHFDEFLQDWFVKQATMQGVAKYYQKVFDYINGVVEDGSVPTQQEIENARLLADEAALKSDALMQAYAGIFGLGGEGSLSGLAAGIQGMTEEQANILEAYWNSVRMYSANIDMNVTRIAQILGAGGDNSNPMLRQMELVRENTDNIRSLLNSVSFNGGEGVGIRVYSF